MLLILRYYYIRAVHDCTSLILRKISFYISCLYSHCCLYAYVYIILTPYEYYMVLPALAINVASKPRLATSALHTALLSNSIIYRIAGNFRGVLIFVIFVTIPRVTKFSTHEFFHPRIFSRLLTSFAYRASGVTKKKTRKLILKTRDSFSRKFAPPKITRYTVYLSAVYTAVLCYHDCTELKKNSILYFRPVSC